MITAWVLLVSTSIILARYFKTAWPGDKLCNVAIWFAVSIVSIVLTCRLKKILTVFMPDVKEF